MSYDRVALDLITVSWDDNYKLQGLVSERIFSIRQFVPDLHKFDPDSHKFCFSSQSSFEESDKKGVVLI